MSANRRKKVSKRGLSCQDGQSAQNPPGVSWISISVARSRPGRPRWTQVAFLEHPPGGVHLAKKSYRTYPKRTTSTRWISIRVAREPLGGPRWIFDRPPGQFDLVNKSYQTSPNRLTVPNLTSTSTSARGVLFNYLSG